MPQLVARGHDVTGMTHSESKRDLVRSLGARPAVADALDPDAVAQAVAEAEPEVIVHQLTALSGPFDLRHFDRTFALTNRLRTEGTDHLLAAGRAVGARRFVAQSFAGWGVRARRRDGEERERSARSGPAGRDPCPLDAIRHTEEAVTAIDWGEGVVLRYGGFYGPGTSLSSDPEAEMSGAIRKRQLPVVGNGDGVRSFIHIEDAATATVEAVEHGERGIYHVVDDEPAPTREWMPVAGERAAREAAAALPPLAGAAGCGRGATVMMTEARGASNAKAKRELGWQPRYASWRQGFAEGLG